MLAPGARECLDESGWVAGIQGASMERVLARTGKLLGPATHGGWPSPTCLGRGFLSGSAAGARQHS